ncbi:unnamed protein product [Cochlearia groenlandica]
MRSSNNLTLMILSIITLILVSESQGTILSKEKKKELEKQLNQINKPAVKSFQTENGEIFDCIDIHKQVAFDHPLLKNHSVQLKPTSAPEWITRNNISQKVSPSQLMKNDIVCPHGTVIVKRTTMKDLLNASHLKSIGFNSPRHVPREGNNIDITGYHFAWAGYSYSTVYGVKANINLWDIKVLQDQFSAASMEVAGGPIQQLASISVGWMAKPLLYGNHIHLYAYWTSDGYKTGCFDTTCPGFVQVSKRISLGAHFQQVSVYGGIQKVIDLSLHQDRATGDWWFVLGGENVGYWPNALFVNSGLAKGTKLASWGGQVYSPLTEKSPFMGSGHFPKEGFGKAAFINGIQIIDRSGEALIPQIYTIKTHSSNPKCYKSKYTTHADEELWMRTIYYGGPGGCIGLRIFGSNFIAMSSFEKHLLLTFSTLALILVAESRKATPLEEEEKDELRLLNSINKPAIKSFRTKHGDVFDCIEIHKQLAFDHPLLKNHSIQLRPTSTPKWTINNNRTKKDGSMPFQKDEISCPHGTVVVKRTTLEDLTISQHLKSSGLKHARYVSSMDKNVDLTGYHFAMGTYNNKNYGAKGNLNVWEPQVSPNQVSSGTMLIARGNKEQFQSVRVGWIVYQWLNRNHSRLHTYWTADGYTKTGCYNTLCPGFIQVSKKIALGFLFLPVSSYGGDQYELDVNIYQDRTTGNWWLAALYENIGYWPKSLFAETGLGHGAELVAYGGAVYGSDKKEKSPAMGSGHFPNEGLFKSGYVNGIEVVSEFGGGSRTPHLSQINKLETTPNCYKIIKSTGLAEKWYTTIVYGGPGGCTS